MFVSAFDFGPVSRAEFSTDNSMHLIVGKNNIGKSFSLVAYYFLLQSVLEAADSMVGYFYKEDLIDDGMFSAGEASELKSRLKSSSRDIDASGVFYDAARTYISSSVAKSFSEKIKASFGSISAVANKNQGAENPRVIYGNSEWNFTISCNNFEDGFICTDLEADFKIILRRVTRPRAIARDKRKVVIYCTKEEPISDICKRVQAEGVRYSSVLSSMLVDNIADVTYLPASRSGLYQALSSFSVIFAELSKKRAFIESKIEIPGISGQLSDYFMKISEISPSADAGEFDEIALAVEREVLGGRIEYEFERKRMYYIPEGTDVRIELSVASSMVSETGPVVIFLRHILTKKQKYPSRNRSLNRRSKGGLNNLKHVLIIEEPEAHLHPENQIRMVEMYSRLAATGVRIVMTSHSNYVFNKLSNVVISGALDAARVRCDIFEVELMGSVANKLDVDQYGIEDSNFADISEELLSERLELIDKRMETELQGAEVDINEH